MQVGEAMGYETCRTLFKCSEDFFTVQKGRTTCDGNGKNLYLWKSKKVFLRFGTALLIKAFNYSLFTTDYGTTLTLKKVCKDFKYLCTLKKIFYFNK